jgi:hypothetical protein
VPSPPETRSASATGSAPPARRLAGALAPVAAQVYFAPEAHRAYQRLGFGGSPAERRGVQSPDGPAYFCSRGSVLGQVPGPVVAAAFGVFNPAAVIPSVAHGWTLTDAPTICAARTEAGTAQLVRVLGERPDGVERARSLLQRAVEPLRPEGKALFSGLLSLGLPGDPVGDVAATRTSRPGRRPGSTPPRSGCSPRPTGACRCAPTSAPAPGAPTSSTRPRSG